MASHPAAGGGRADEHNGYLDKGSTWTASSYGFEICDTGGTNENFQMNSFSWTAKK